MNKALQKAVQESHRRQFAGEDYQKVAIEIARRLKLSPDSDEYQELQTGPEPGCECGFCRSAQWQD